MNNNYRGEIMVEIRSTNPKDIERKFRLIEGIVSDLLKRNPELKEINKTYDSGSKATRLEAPGGKSLYAIGLISIVSKKVPLVKKFWSGHGMNIFFLENGSVHIHSDKSLSDIAKQIADKYTNETKIPVILKSE
jgi:hypothetical protein